MDNQSEITIDNHGECCRKTMLSQYGQDVIDRAAKIKLILMDVDGVLTDGSLYYLVGPDGHVFETKGFNSHDGFGLILCSRLGIETGVISGRESPGVVHRAKLVGMKYVIQDKLDKEASWDGILQQAGLSAAEVAFIGDDFPDLPLLRKAGLSFAVANARAEVKEFVHCVLAASGGNGAVREAIEIILKAKGLWTKVEEKYSLNVR